jgi:hypothetical protein
MIIIILYVLSVVLTFVAACFDWKRSFGEVTVGDILLFLALSLIPIGNLGVVFVAILHSDMCKKKVF